MRTGGETLSPTPLLSSFPPTCAICKWGAEGGGGEEGGVSLFFS